MLQINIKKFNGINGFFMAREFRLWEFHLMLRVLKVFLRIGGMKYLIVSAMCQKAKNLIL